jgi:DNA-binding FadR family transcriptional regulator
MNSFIPETLREGAESRLYRSISLTRLFGRLGVASIPPVVVQSRSQAAVESLAKYISTEGLKANDRLPSERVLAANLGISRPILREALRHLAALGIVEAKTGSGTYLRGVLAPNDRHVVMRIEVERESLLQLLELRRALETEAVALAATRCSESDLKKLENLVDVLEQEFAEKGNNTEPDKAFHLALYQYTYNPLFLQLLGQLWDEIEQFWSYPLGKQDFAQRTLPLHRRIYERLHERDPEGARSTVRQMLDIVEEDLRG